MSVKGSHSISSRSALVVIAAILLSRNVPDGLSADPQKGGPPPLRQEGSEARQPLTVFTPDRKLSAVLSTNGIINVHSADGLLLGKFHHCTPITAVFSADATLFCSVGRPQPGVTSFKVWRLADRKLVSEFTSDTEDLPILTFSPKNDFLAATSGRTRVALWELPDGNLKWTASLNRRIAALSFDGNNAVLAQCADKTIKRLPLVKAGDHTKTCP